MLGQNMNKKMKFRGNKALEFLEIIQKKSKIVLIQLMNIQMLRLSVKLFTIINPIQIIPKNVETKKIETYLTLTGLI